MVGDLHKVKTGDMSERQGDEQPRLLAQFGKAHRAAGTNHRRGQLHASVERFDVEDILVGTRRDLESRHFGDQVTDLNIRHRADPDRLADQCAALSVDERQAAFAAHDQRLARALNGLDGASQRHRPIDLKRARFPGPARQEALQAAGVYRAPFSERGTSS